MRRFTRQAAFSLPELIVVIGVVLILLGLILPAVSQARQSAVAVQCRAKMQQVGQLIAAYTSSYRGHLPPFHDNAPWPTAFWPDFVFGEPAPPALLCPTGRDVAEVRTYMLNAWLYIWRVKLPARFRERTIDEVVLMGEGKSGYNSYVGQGWAADPYRHGPRLRSNILWLDFHVSNDPPRPHPGKLPPYDDPWYARPVY